MSVVVDGTEITHDAICREAQYHPAANFDAACIEATQALVVRSLLLSEAKRRGISSGDESEGEVQDAISEVMEVALEVPEVSEATCLAFFEKQPQKFRGPDLFAPSHILIAAEPADSEARGEAKARAFDVLADLKKRPEKFERIARTSSGCPSGARGGNLGQITRGETMPEFEQALLELTAGQIYPTPVETTHGYHVIRLDDRVPGECVPFSSVKDRIMIYLRDQSWRKSLQTFISDLAARASIEGFVLKTSHDESSGAFSLN